MKRLTGLAFSAVIFVLAIDAHWLPAQENKQPPKQLSADKQLKLAKPGPEHEKLARYAGKWTVQIKMGDGNSAIEYQGTAECRMTAGGRFLQMEYQAAGKAGDLEGAFTVGYDRRHQHYTLIAIDTFGDYFVTSFGKGDSNTDKIRLQGADDDPMMKAIGYTKEFVHVLDLRGADEYAIEIYFVDTRTPARRELKFMEYTFKRQK